MTTKKRDSITAFGNDIPTFLATCTKQTFKFTWGCELEGTVGNHRWHFRFFIYEDEGWWYPDMLFKVGCVEEDLSKVTPALIDRIIEQNIGEDCIPKDKVEGYKREVRRIVSLCWKTVLDDAAPEDHVSLLEGVLLEMKPPTDVKKQYPKLFPSKARTRKKK